VRMEEETQGIVVAYDLKCYKYDAETNRGFVPSKPLRYIRALIRGNKVRRLQNSVLLVEDPSVLDELVNTLKPYASKLLVSIGKVWYGIRK